MCYEQCQRFIALPVATVVVFCVMFAAMSASAQTLTVLHNFTGKADGDGPFAGVTLDQQNRVYGTATLGGSHSQGVVYRLVRQGEGWVFSPIYSFGAKQHDGDQPYARVLFGPDGLLYGTTYGGGSQGNGTVFSLQPPASACKAFDCSWTETVLYNFTGGADGGNPFLGDLAFDQAGNIYGTTAYGGSSGYGVVFKLTRSGSSWTESVLWDFTCGKDGCNPYAGVLFDSAGNLYGTTQTGGDGNGTVYELSPTQSGWSETTLSTAAPNGSFTGGLAMDAYGNLFGMTGNVQPGAVYKLTPQNGSWSLTVLTSFTQILYTGPLAAPTLDSQEDNLYGPVPNGGSGEVGEIFKLTRAGDQWIFSEFYQFTLSGDDGEDPIGAVTLDSSGNVYGTTNFGGSGEGGTVWEITP